MIAATIRRADLVALRACSGGLALYDAIAEHQGGVRATVRLRSGARATRLRTDRVRLRCDGLGGVWLAWQCPTYTAWLRCAGMVPAVSAPRTDLRGADLRGANLQGANFEGANFEGADLQWADLEGADLRVANFEGADLRVANLRGANLRGAKFEGANLRGANFEGADLRGANFEGADLRRAVAVAVAR